MRKHLVLVSAITASAALVTAVLPASAADQTVSATPDDTFSAKTVTVTAGDTVTWRNDGGRHNVRFDDGSFEMPAAPATNAWTVSHRFDTPGTFTYYCEQHRDVGMTGTVVVGAAPGTPPRTPPGTNPGPAPQPPAGASPAPVVTDFVMTRSRFRVGPGATALSAARARRGSAFEFRLSRAATVRIALSRVLTGRGGKKRHAGKGTLVRRGRRAGANTVPFSGRVGRGALAKGLYRATIRATGANGRRSKARRTSFRIVSR
jgi:plastocyanin